MELTAITPTYTATGVSLSYSIKLDKMDAYGVQEYRGVTAMSLADTFTAMSKATASDPFAGFRLVALNDFRTQRQADITAVDKLIATLNGTTATSETTSQSASTSTSTAQA